MDTSKEPLWLQGNKARWRNYEKLTAFCFECDAEFSRPPSVFKKGKGKFCSQKCANAFNGREKSVLKHFKANGYLYIKTWEHPFRSKQNLVAEHRLIVEYALDRYLKPTEVVHHIDGNKRNNELYNLYLCESDLQHRQIHSVEISFLQMLNPARYIHWEQFKHYDASKNRQDQLQEMSSLGRANPLLGIQAFYNSLSARRKMFEYYHGNFASMEQLWLGFVMSEKFGKIYNGTGWVTNNTSKHP